ncbi:MAG: TRAP transporter small permease [Alphaproteobacteria bacterium]
MLKRAIVGASRALDRGCRWVAVVGVVLMVVLIGIQVIARYVVQSSPGWTEEGARYAMVWAGLLGAAIAFRMRVDPVMLQLEKFESGRWRILGGALRAFATLLFLGPILWFCVVGPGGDLTRGFVARSAARAAETVGVPMSWFTIALPIAIVVIFVHLAASLLGDRPKPAAGDLL